MSGAEVNMLKPPIFHTFSAVQSSWNGIVCKGSYIITKQICNINTCDNVLNCGGSHGSSGNHDKIDAMMKMGGFLILFQWKSSTRAFNVILPDPAAAAVKSFFSVKWLYWLSDSSVLNHWTKMNRRHWKGHRVAWWLVSFQSCLQMQHYDCKKRKQWHLLDKITISPTSM